MCQATYTLYSIAWLDNFDHVHSRPKKLKWFPPLKSGRKPPRVLYSIAWLDNVHSRPKKLKWFPPLKSLLESFPCLLIVSDQLILRSFWGLFRHSVFRFLNTCVSSSVSPLSTTATMANRSLGWLNFNTKLCPFPKPFHSLTQHRAPTHSYFSTDCKIMQRLSSR